MYDGREFLFGGRTIPVKNCSRNGGCNPAIFILFSFVFNASPCASVYVGARRVCVFVISLLSSFSCFFPSFFFWWEFYRAEHADTLIAKVSGYLFDTGRTRINWILISCLFICPISHRTKMLDDVRARCFIFPAEQDDILVSACYLLNNQPSYKRQIITYISQHLES